MSNEFYRQTEQGTIRIPMPEQEFVKKITADIAYHIQKVMDLQTILEDVIVLKNQGEELTFSFGADGYKYKSTGEIK